MTGNVVAARPDSAHRSASTSVPHAEGMLGREPGAGSLPMKSPRSARTPRRRGPTWRISRKVDCRTRSRRPWPAGVVADEPGVGQPWLPVLPAANPDSLRIRRGAAVEPRPATKLPDRPPRHSARACRRAAVVEIGAAARGSGDGEGWTVYRPRGRHCTRGHLQRRDVAGAPGRWSTGAGRGDAAAVGEIHHRPVGDWLTA